MSTAQKVLTVLAEVTETDEVARDLKVRLYDQQILDSMKTVELILAFSRTFAVDISPAEFDRDEWATPGQIVSYMEAKVGP